MTHEQLTTLLTDNLNLPAERAAGLLSALRRPHAGADPIDTACVHCDLDHDDLLEMLTRQVLRHSEHVRLSQVRMQDGALSYIPAREAWDYLILPLSVEPDGHLRCCTTEQSVPTALAYLMRHLPIPFRLVLSDVRPLEQFIAEQYRYEGLDCDSEAA